MAKKSQPRRDTEQWQQILGFWLIPIGDILGLTMLPFHAGWEERTQANFRFQNILSNLFEIMTCISNSDIPYQPSQSFGALRRKNRGNKMRTSFETKFKSRQRFSPCDKTHNLLFFLILSQVLSVNDESRDQWNKKWFLFKKMFLSCAGNVEEKLNWF